MRKIFWLDGTLHQTWSRVGCQPQVETYGLRKTAHVYGAIELNQATFSYQFASVFNGRTFLGFLKQLIRKYPVQKIFLIIDNGPCHNLDDDGKKWLSENHRKINLFRLPPYSPELNAIEAVWKTTRKFTTHNRFYGTVEERDSALRDTFTRFQRKPGLISAHTARFR
jgi:transposase